MRKTLEEKISRGVAAKQQIADIGLRLKEIENRTIAGLVNAVRNNEPIEPHAYRLWALSELGSDLQTDIDTGRRAAQKLDEQAQQAAQKVNNG